MKATSAFHPGSRNRQGLCRLGLAMLLAGSVDWSFATDPSALWNVDGQVRTHTCTPMAGVLATLRFPDGTPTGFFAYADDPSKNGSSPDCAIGYVEMDAQEMLTNAAGVHLYFHPGGGPDLYNDYVNKGQYGHIDVADLAAAPVLQPLNLNGRGCATANVPALETSMTVNLIGVADDGAIYGANLTTGTASPPQFLLYRWADETSPRTLVYAGDPSNGSTNAADWRWGNTLAVRGAGASTQVLIGSQGTLAAVLRPADSSMTAFTASTLATDVPADALGAGLAFGAADTFWATGGAATGGPLRLMSFDLNAGTASTLRAFTASNFPSAVSPLAVLAASNLLAGIEMCVGPDLVRLYDISNMSSAPVLLDRQPWISDNTNTESSGALAFGGPNRLYALDSDNGILAFTVLPASTNPLPPAVYLHPITQVVQAGSNVVLSAAADGTPPLHYQWQRDGNAVPGATGTSLNLLNAQPAESGSYRVVVTNSWGSATSSVATLTVLTVTNNPIGLINYEPFPYLPGSLLAGQGGWLLNSGASGSTQAGSFSAPGLATSISNHFAWTSSSMSLRLPIGTNSTGPLYFSFLLRIPSLGTASSDTLAGFTTGTTTSYAPKVNVVSNSFGTYNLGIYKSSGLTTGALATNLFTTNDVVFVVARYIFSASSTTDDTCDLWLNPDPASFGTASPPAPTIGAIGAGRTDMTQIDRFFFRSAGPALQCEADELRIGTNWASVTPPIAGRLAITGNGNTATLFWPTNPPGFVLEQSPSLSSPSWTPVTDPATLNGTNNNVSTRLTNDSRFYRLRK